MTHSNKIARLVGFAAEASRNSVQQFKHGAVLCKGGKKICCSHNMDTRTSYRRNICCSIHAEMGAVTKFLNSYIKIHSHSKRDPEKIKRKLGKFSICVVRSIVSENNIHCVTIQWATIDLPTCWWGNCKTWLTTYWCSVGGYICVKALHFTNT